MFRKILQVTQVKEQKGRSNPTKATFHQPHNVPSLTISDELFEQKVL